MDADHALSQSRAGIRAMLESWAETPALLLDRHLTVLAANAAAEVLSPAFAEGMNLARFTFLDPDIDRDDLSYDAAAHQVAALLRESLEQHEGDAQFRGIVGDLSVFSPDFALAWADESLAASSRGVIDFSDTPVGLIRLQYQLLRVPHNDEDSLLVWGPADTESGLALVELRQSPPSTEAGTRSAR